MMKSCTSKFLNFNKAGPPSYNFVLRKIHPNKYLRDYLEKDIRPDSRKKLEFRPVIININSISNAEGSALVKLGNTTVICGIKAVRDFARQSSLDSIRLRFAH